MDLREFTDSPELAAQAGLASRALSLNGVPAPGVYAAGVTHADGHDALFFLVDVTLAPAQPTPVPYIAGLFMRIESALGQSASGSLNLSDALALGVSTPLPQYGPADSVTCLSSGIRTPGTFGGRVVGTPRPGSILPAGQMGILTAGHVARSLNAQAFDSGGQVGIVRHVSLPTLAVPLPTLDVAVIQAGASTQPANAYGIISSTQITSANLPSVVVENVAARVRGRVPASSGVHAFAPAVWFPGFGLWSDLYITMQQISDPGDSGAPVVIGGSSVLVGHIVGASPGFCSYVQDIGAQLQALQCDLF